MFVVDAAKEFQQRSMEVGGGGIRKQYFWKSPLFKVYRWFRGLDLVISCKLKLFHTTSKFESKVKITRYWSPQSIEQEAMDYLFENWDEACIASIKTRLILT